MAIVSITNTSVAVNPLKYSQPVGATLAFLGIKGILPILHGSPGCSAFTKVALISHLGEIIPVSTTAMTEVTTILGGEDNVKQAIINLVEKYQPEILGVYTTGLTETRGDDIARFLKDLRREQANFQSLPIVLVSTPDFKGSLQDGFAATVESIVKEIPQKRNKRWEQINILTSSAFTPGDVEEFKEIISDFGLNAIIIPDISGLLDVNLDAACSAVTTSGITLEKLSSAGDSIFTLALGESMRGAARILQQKFGIPYDVLTELTGLEATDKFLYALSQISGKKVPDKYLRQRRHLQDLMLKNHLCFGCKRVALALEPDLLWSIVHFLQSLGVQIHAAVTSARSPLLERLNIASVTIGDLEDFELLASGADLLIANSHAASLAQRLNIPLYRQGIPIFDRLGYSESIKIGYRGSMQVLFDVANLLM